MNTKPVTFRDIAKLGAEAEIEALIQVHNTWLRKVKWDSAWHQFYRKENGRVTYNRLTLKDVQALMKQQFIK